MDIDWKSENRNKNCAAPMSQQPAYGVALTLLGREVVNARITQNDRLIACAQVILRRVTPFGGVALMPRGPLWFHNPNNKQRRAAISLLAQTVPLPRLRAMISNCEHSSDGNAMQHSGNISIITPQHIAQLDLRPSEALRRSAMSGKWRNRLRVAENSRLEVTHTQHSDDPSHWLLQQDARQRRIKGYRGLPATFTLAYCRANTKLTRLFIASNEGTIVAAMLFLMHGRSATYHIGWINAEGRLLSAHNLILSEAGNWLAAQGYTNLDLGVVDTEAASGLARFKIGSGAYVRPLGATWLHTPLTAGPTRLIARIPPRRL